MPIYCFACPKCKINFEELCSWTERDQVTCPKCKKKPEQRTTAPGAIMFSNPRGTSKEDNFDYVAKTNYENAQNFRRMAEAENKYDFNYNEIDDLPKYEGKIGDVDPFLQG